MTEPRDPGVIDPLQRRIYPAAELVRQHPPVLRHPNKQVLYAIACPAGTVHSGRLEYTRWPEEPVGWDGQPLCGECVREREFIDQEVEMQEADADD